jgi:pimeloyl-ACP methyl ester carboxylesterase
MKSSWTRFSSLIALGALAVLGCATTPVERPMEHCPDADCPGAMLTSQGPDVEPKTGRKFFLDLPRGWKKGDKITFILSLHGGGSYGNWQRHYFPILDYKDKYDLVIATPNAPPRVWAPTDDEYLQNIVSMVYEKVGEANIKAFWLVGHSQGGMTANRISRTAYFQDKVDGFLSLSGGRLGPTPPIPQGFFRGRAPPGAATPAVSPSGSAPATAQAAPRLPAMPAGLPDGSFSHIFATGEHEIGARPIPDESPWAQKLGCGRRVRRADVIDTKPGYVYDSTSQDPGTKEWGLLPRGGKAEISVYRNCKGGKVVADVVRIDKGHTEGLEPKITEALVKLMLSAK